METRSQRTRRCPHCGRELEPIVLPALFGAKEPHVVGFESCGCPGAKAERSERERKEAERRAREEAENKMTSAPFSAAATAQHTPAMPAPTITMSWV